MKKHKKLFIILTTIVVVLNVVLFCVPASAHDGTIWRLYIYDHDASSSIMLEVPQMEDAYGYRFEYSIVDYSLKIYATYQNSSDEMIYCCLVPVSMSVDCTIQCDGGVDYNEFTFAYPLHSNVTGYLNPTYDTVMITLEFTSYYYTYQQLQDAKQEGYQEGLDAVDANLQTIYDQGREYGESVGYQRGLEDSKTGLGLTNVALSSLYYTFTYLMSQLNVFGVSLGSILVSVAFILLIYFIFKIVKG